MHLYDLPMICVLAGLALYTILGGADFGAGIWQLLTLIAPRRSPQAHERSQRLREHAHHAMGPVWEANHVWLIFVLTVTWTAYPTAFGAITSTLAVPLLMAGIGVIFRGAAYALRAGTSRRGELSVVDGMFSVASALTPFALGTMIGAITAGRVPVGNATGELFGSWLNPLSLTVGALSVAVSAYTAAVYLAADGTRHDERALAEAFRTRALIAGALAGVIALAALPILHADAHRVFERLLSGPGLVGVAISVLGGVATLMLVTMRHFEQARLSAAIAVAGLIIGWALAQQPILLPGLTLAQAAAPTATLVSLLAAIALGAVILFPSLALLFGLLIGGRFDPEHPAGDVRVGAGEIRTSLAHGLSARLAVATLLAAVGFLTLADPPWAHVVGVLSLLACAWFGFRAVDPLGLADADQADGPTDPMR
jgi:cytochrome bd ubiquinol oxidase subunit II